LPPRIHASRTGTGPHSPEPQTDPPGYNFHDDPQKIQFDRDLQVYYAKGKGLKVDSVSPFRHLAYFYGYKQLTLFSPDILYYASTEAQPTRAR
jgi:hypothetical protein